MSIDLTYIGV